MSSGNGDSYRRDGILWRLQSLLRKREAESVRDRMEELIEAPERDGEDGTPATPPTSTPRNAPCSATS
ncbi:hypothetical protein ACFQU2_24685 [Siccirubricoccus deserti]